MLYTILGIVGWIGTLLVFAGVAIRMFRPQWDQYAYWAAISGLVCVALYTLSQWREIGRSFSKRETRFSLMSIISIVAVLAILVGINYLVIRRDKQCDLTATKSFTLSDETGKVLNNLKGPVRITVYDQPQGFQRFRDALTPYGLASRNVSVEYVDADREQEVTNGLVKVTSGRQVKVYFIEGHGEKSSTGVERNGYSSALDVLKRDNYTVDKLVLAQSPEVPKDASVIVVAGPTADYLQPEIDAIRKYLRGGGKALFLLDPRSGE